MATPMISIAAPNGSSSVQPFNPSSIDIVTRSSQVIGGMAHDGFDVMQFHNTINDALRSGTLSNMNMSNINGLISTLPSDWKSKFTSDSSGLNELLNNVNGLMDLANDVWSKPQSTGSSSWMQDVTPGTWTYGNLKPSVHEINGPSSTASNAGTYKEGMADHPDVSEMEKVFGFGMLGYKSYTAGAQGLGLLGDAEAAEAAGEGVFGALGLAGETGLGLSAAAVGTAVGVTEVAAAAVGLAAIGYGIYKMAGGTGSSGFLDKATSSLGGAMDWLSAHI